MNLGYKLIHDDLTSYGGFQWPSEGQVVASNIDRDNTGPCPSWPGDGLCVALTFRGATSAGFRPRVLWLAYDDSDVLGFDSNKVRVSAVTVLGTSLLREVSLCGANLYDADLGGAKLAGANLSGANLSCAYLSGAYLRNADLRNAKLSGAYLRNADLRNAKLSGAKLAGAKLVGADLSGADLYDADLSGADLAGADLSDADLRGAYRLRSDPSIDGWRLDSMGWLKRG